MSRIRVAGIDPGTRSVGVGVVERDGNRLSLVGMELIAPGRMSGDLPARLRAVHLGIREALVKYRPDAMALEEAFYGQSAQSSLRIGEGRGVAILAAALEGIQVHQYPPATVKKAVTGSGAAHKSQVGHMVKVLLNLTGEVREDVADALAVAICHLNRT